MTDISRITILAVFLGGIVGFISSILIAIITYILVKVWWNRLGDTQMRAQSPIFAITGGIISGISAGVIAFATFTMIAITIG